MLESYIRTPDGKDYVDVDCVMEALGIVDDDVNIFRVIEKLKQERDGLKQERDGLKADLELTDRLYKENHDFVDRVCEAVDIQRPYLESGYDDAVRLIAGFKRERDKLREDKDLLEELHANHISQLKDYAELAFELGIERGDAESIKDYIISLKKERDELKEKCNKLKARTNAMYGASCGYSTSKQPAFRCNVTRLETLRAIDDRIDELCDKYVVVQPDRKSTTKERLDYIFGVLDEWRTLANNNFNKAEGFRKEKRAVENVLAELRAKIREIYRSVVDDEWDEYRGYTSALNDINEEYKRVVHKLKDDGCNAEKEFLDAVKKRIGVSADCSDNAHMLRLLDIKLDHSALSTFTDNVYKELGLPRYGYTLTETIYNLKNRLDCYARLRSDICTALGLGGETSKNTNPDIINRVIEIRESHEKLCKDYTDLRKAIWEAMDRKPETLPEENARLVGEIAELARGEKLLIEFRDDVAKAIGITYPTTNNFITGRVADIYKDCGNLHDILPKLRGEILDLQNKYADAESRFRFQSGLRQQWHARYESEHERANCVQKALDREREKCRVKDISLETAKKQYEKVCSNLETAECALNGMKSKVRGLQEEKTKVISALGQDIWDDCVK